MAKTQGNKAVSKKATSKLVVCGCSHDYQDKRYGKGKRVACLQNNSERYVCTVCKKEHA